MRLTFTHLFFIALFAAGCQRPSQADVQKVLQEVTFEGVKFPEPKFDGDLGQLVEKLKGGYKAERVLIGRPIRFNSMEDYDYWLKVELLNPEIEERDFKVFGKEVALEVVGHITQLSLVKK
jgi:hypothetical protein